MATNAATAAITAVTVEGVCLATITPSTTRPTRVARRNNTDAVGTAALCDKGASRVDVEVCRRRLTHAALTPMISLYQTGITKAIATRCSGAGS